MVRQFLIPWILLIKFPQVFCQPPQPPGFDPFQHLFTHPTLAPPNSFGINGFSPLYNTHMIHPHYDLLAAGGTNVMNPNFVHPHPFFPIHPHQFPVTLPVTTTTIASSTVSKITTILSPQTSLQPITTTTEKIITETTKEITSTRVPQAAKPALGSVKTYSPENETKDQMASLSTLEKMEKSVENSPSPRVTEIRKSQTFPTPSSTILPTAQQITNQTMQSSSTTTQSTTISSTTVQVTQPTTNLPKKISAEAEKTALNGEKLDLIRHLNTSDLESFLQSANLSTHEAQNFLKLVEKVLEEELQKRLNKQVTNGNTETIKPDLSIQNLEPSNPTISAAISSIKQTDPKILNSDGHEVKTVNTRLNYESAEIDQSTGISPNSTSSKMSTSSTPSTPSTPSTYSKSSNQNPSTYSKSSNQNPSRIVAYSQRSALEINSADKSHANPTFNSLDDIRKREQEEFDKLLGQIVLNTGDSEPNKQEEIDQTEDDDLLPSGTQNTNPPIQLPPRNNFNRPAIRHPPKTNFDKLAQDYQFRLSNSNGLNDLIKALRNAHIGFFDRTKKNRPKIRID